VFERQSSVYARVRLAKDDRIAGIYVRIGLILDCGFVHIIGQPECTMHVGSTRF
jgi:hypothetical protein